MKCFFYVVKGNLDRKFLKNNLSVIFVYVIRDFLNVEICMVKKII